MNTKELTNKELPIIDADYILEVGRSMEDSPHHKYRFSINNNSMIVVFEGRRGGGKTTMMTFMVMLAVAINNQKVVSNYPIEFNLRRSRPDGKTYLQHFKSESLDFSKLILFDEQYRNVLIVIDEAPDVISHMASQSWKNRLVAAFTRQLRKSNNSLFLGAQDENLIDKSMRWQVDMKIKCVDASKIVSDNNLDPGEMIFTSFFDESGQITGMTTEDRYRSGKVPWINKAKLFPRVMWGDDAHLPVYDSWYQIDILENLRKVDLQLSSMKITDKTNNNGYRGDRGVLKRCLDLITNICHGKDLIIEQPKLYKLIGANPSDKLYLSPILEDYGVIKDKCSRNGKKMLDFASFNFDDFRLFVTDQIIGQGDIEP